jgi:hypothetical protein
MAAMWRAADLLHEQRGDSHVMTWAVGSVDAVEIPLLTEQWWGLPARAYTPGPTVAASAASSSGQSTLCVASDGPDDLGSRALTRHGARPFSVGNR